jgi:hypothetical protein
MANNSMFHPNADLFFADPANVPANNGTFGVLYLLRRDVRLCLGVDPATGARIHNPVVWPGAMAVLAGTDLLAKFYAGSDAKGGVTTRFQNFVRNFFHPLSPGDDVTLYQLRNSLLHSFGLYSQTPAQTYHFHVTAIGNVPLIQHTPPVDYQIDLLELYNRFEQAITNYSTALEAQQQLQTKFLAMFANYGAIQRH